MDEQSISRRQEELRVILDKFYGDNRIPVSELMAMAFIMLGHILRESNKEGELLRTKKVLSKYFYELLALDYDLIVDD